MGPIVLQGAVVYACTKRPKAPPVVTTLMPVFARLFDRDACCSKLAASVQ